MSDAISLDRREFLRAGMFGSALLAGGATVASLSGCSSVDGPAEGYLHLRRGDVEILSLLAPVVLAGAMTDEHHDVPKVLKRLDALFDGVLPRNRAPLFELYDVLQLGAFRWWATDTWTHPSKLSREQLDVALGNWSRKQNSFVRLAFNGLCQPLTMAWYTDPDNARSTGYPGPPRKVNA
jgi:hypothetical protein